MRHPGDRGWLVGHDWRCVREQQQAGVEQNGSWPVNPAARPTRRSFTAEYKAAVVAEYKAAAHGEKSAVLCREGLFHSHVQEWTRARGAAVTPGGS